MSSHYPASTYAAAARAAEQLDPSTIRGGTIHRGPAAAAFGRRILAGRRPIHLASETHQPESGQLEGETMSNQQKDSTIWATCPRCHWREEADDHGAAFRLSRDHFDDAHTRRQR